MVIDISMRFQFCLNILWTPKTWHLKTQGNNYSNRCFLWDFPFFENMFKQTTELLISHSCRLYIPSYSKIITIIYLSIYRSIYLSIYLSIYIYISSWNPNDCYGRYLTLKYVALWGWNWAENGLIHPHWVAENGKRFQSSSIFHRDFLRNHHSLGWFNLRGTFTVEPPRFHGKMMENVHVFRWRFGGFLKWGYPQIMISRWDFHKNHPF